MIERRLIYLMIIAQCLLTIVHHIYGEFFLYRDGMRLHAVVFAPFALLLTFAPLLLHRTVFGWRMFTLWSIAIWVIGAGVFEGFWNHLVVNLLYLADRTNEFSHFFIRSEPGDLIFEITGIAQLVLAGCIVLWFKSNLDLVLSEYG